PLRPQQRREPPHGIRPQQRRRAPTHVEGREFRTQLEEPLPRHVVELAPQGLPPRLGPALRAPFDREVAVDAPPCAEGRMHVHGGHGGRAHAARKWKPGSCSTTPSNSSWTSTDRASGTSTPARTASWSTWRGPPTKVPRIRRSASPRGGSPRDAPGVS